MVRWMMQKWHHFVYVCVENYQYLVLTKYYNKLNVEFHLSHLLSSKEIERMLSGEIQTWFGTLSSIVSYDNNLHFPKVFIGSQLGHLALVIIYQCWMLIAGCGCLFCLHDWRTLKGASKISMSGRRRLSKCLKHNCLPKYFLCLLFVNNEMLRVNKCKVKVQCTLCLKP